MQAVLDFLRRHVDPSAEPVRIALFVGLALAGLAHLFVPSVAVAIDAAVAVVVSAWARSKVYPGA